MKKIIISSNTCWSIFNFRLDLVKFLAKTYLVEIVAPEDQYSNKIREMGFVVHNVKMNSSAISPLQDILTLFSYYKVLRKTKPDYYLGFTAKPNIYGGFIASRLGYKVINNIAGLGRVFSTPGVIQSIMRLLYRVGLSQSRHVFFQNDDDRKLFHEGGILRKVNNSVLPGSGVNTKRFNCKLVRSDFHNSNDNHFVFLFSARLLLEKGIREYIAAAKKLKGVYPFCKFWILGKHSGTSAEIPKNELNAACNSNIVEYFGMTDDVVTSLHQTDCFVLPSYYREGIPRSLLEAGSCGLPLITTNSVGCRETVINGENGYLVPPRSMDALFEAMKAIVELSVEERHIMGLKSRRYMESKFSEDFVFEQYQNILTEQ